LVEHINPPFDGWLAEVVAANAGVEKIKTGATLISNVKTT
jgi:hypothetical protein